MVLDEFSLKNTKMAPVQFLNGPNRTKVENMTMAEILVYNVKSGLLH